MLTSMQRFMEEISRRCAWSVNDNVPVHGHQKTGQSRSLTLLITEQVKRLRRAVRPRKATDNIKELEGTGWRAECTEVIKNVEQQWCDPALPCPEPSLSTGIQPQITKPTL